MKKFQVIIEYLDQKGEIISTYSYDTNKSENWENQTPIVAEAFRPKNAYFVHCSTKCIEE